LNDLRWRRISHVRGDDVEKADLVGRVVIVPELGVERQTLDCSLQRHEASIACSSIRQLERVHASIQAILPHQGTVHHRRAADGEAMQLRQSELAGER
jgi:hypothetical protein